eukprot:scaffold2193_cov179-Ochromonas_danica.AAC.43
MMNNIVPPSPIHSISFQQENVAPPNAIRVEDLGQIETLKTRKRQAKAYCKTVKRLKVDEDTVTVHDVAAAEDFEDGARVPDRFNQTILRLDAIDQGLSGMDNHFNGVNRRLDAIEARQKNASASASDDDFLVASLVNGGPPPLQLDTIGAVMELSLAECAIMEDYFNLPVTTLRAEGRKKRILRLGYGVHMLKVITDA